MKPRNPDTAPSPYTAWRDDAFFWRVISAIAAVAIIFRLLFWRYTGRVWEDALITILHAENAVRGIGLTHYKVDEPLIHGFTSPLSVLIPLLGEWISPGFGLDFMRIVSAATSAATIFLAAAILRNTPGLSLRPAMIYMACGYLAIEHHQMLWGMAGMETQVVTTIILMSIHAFVRRRPFYLGVTLGLCMLVRPDFAFWAALVGIAETWRAVKMRDPRPLFITVAVALALYLPWIAFTTWYYGSPVPNTIHAKSNGYGMWWKASPDLWTLLLEAIRRLRATIFPLLGPTFGGNGTGFIPFTGGVTLSVLMLAVAVTGTLALLRERAWRAASIAGFVAIYALYYLFFVPNVFGWYVVPFTAVTILLVAKGADVLLGVLPVRQARYAGAGVALLYVGAFAAVLPQTTRGEKNIQRFVENPVRIEIGRWLHDHTPADATVAGEPLGYMGYYSGRTYYDYPGLASAEVVRFVKTSGMPGLPYMIQEMRPDYLVLRDMEIASLRDTHHNRWFADLYEPVRTYEVLPAHREKLLHAEANIDLRFTVFQRRFGVQREPIADALPAGTRILEVQPAKLDGNFRLGAKYFDAPSIEGDYYGSWVTSDADNGTLALPFKPIDTTYIAVPFITGPVTYDLELQVFDTDSGTELRSLHTLHGIPALPVTVKSWRYWLVEIPPASRGHHLEIRARDASSAWGGWFAVGTPRHIPGNFFASTQLQASKRPSRAPSERPTTEHTYE